jgi:anti-sigma factor RsiW
MMRWQCRFYRAVLVDHADGVLAAAQRQRLTRHLAHCAGCRTDLEVLRDLPSVVRTSTVPDPGEAFWRQQRQAIGRSIRSLPQPRAASQVERLLDTLRWNPWRYPLAATLALLLALLVYQTVERPPAPRGAVTAAQLAALDTDALLSLNDLVEAVTPPDDALSYTPGEDEVAVVAVAIDDLVGPHTLANGADDAELNVTDLEHVDDLIGTVG